jgi:hypothetical protein
MDLRALGSLNCAQGSLLNPFVTLGIRTALSHRKNRCFACAQHDMHAIVERGVKGSSYCFSGGAPLINFSISWMSTGLVM